MFILASGSPRRKELLEQIGARFQVIVSAAEEESGDEWSPEELVEKNAAAKAAAVAASHSEYPVLGADTVVSLDGHTYGKPCSSEDACSMLRRLSGRSHQVSTGLALVYEGRVYTSVVTTQVQFALLSEPEIAAYVATGEPMDKAGAYAIQGRAEAWVRFIQGSYSGVVGLPLFETRALLAASGLALG